jgi:hypothetical protein
MNRKSVVILIFAHKPVLEWYEAISLEQCFRVLDRHPIRLVCPIGLDVSAYRLIAPAVEIDFIPPHWLASRRAYNRLKILPWLYRRYADHEFILTYELDAFVFRDELLDWCDQGWDYIGAPWFEGYHVARPDAAPIGVGNSGLSLRRIGAMLRVTRSWKAIRPPIDVFHQSCRIPTGLSPWRRYLNVSVLWQFFNNLLWKNCFHHYLNWFPEGEDIFWACAGARIDGFRMASHEVARHFSFEVNPERLFLECGNKLPFGCHKWMKYQPDFWKPFIEGEGYRWLGDNSAENVEAHASNRSRTAARSKQTLS